MFSNLKERVKKITILYFPLSFIKMIYIKFIFLLSRICRFFGIEIYYPYSKLKAFKNLYKGKRCFIIATGPSLELEILERLENEITFSMNSIVLSFKDMKWRPTYYFLQDGRAYKLLKHRISMKDFKNIFIGINYNLTGIFINKFTNKLFDRYIYFPLNLLNHDIPFLKEKVRFSLDPYREVCDGYTITYSIIQLAVYMGFKEIYLMGVDCDYTSKGEKHVVEYVKNDNDKIAEERMIKSYEVAMETAKSYNVKIYNVSYNGNLNVFPRIKLDDVLSKRSRRK